MKAYDLQATNENIKATFLNDSIDRNQDIARFCTILDSVEGGYSIALDGKWGSGKTFFIKQAKMLVDAFNPNIHNSLIEEDVERLKEAVAKYKLPSGEPFDISSQVAVYYDAWSNDNDEDPILSLIYAIVQSVDADFDIGKKRDFIKIVGSIADFFTGRKISGILEALKGEDSLAKIKSNKSVHQLMSEFFEALLVEHGERLIVFIDELDRCKPSYAIKLLERIKHYLGHEQITFVFSVNMEQLQHTVRQYYGNDFSATRYLDRFFDLRMSLLPANLQKYYYSIHFNNTSQTYDKMCHAVIKTYHFELREIAKYVHFTKMAAYKPTRINNNYDFSFYDGKAVQYALLYIVPIMIGLKIYDEGIYNDFVTGKSATPLLEILEKYEFSGYQKSALIDEYRETYDSKQVTNDKTLVQFQEKLENVYHALFAQNYEDNTTEIHIGKLGFSQQTRNEIMRVMSLLSDYADYEN